MVTEAGWWTQRSSFYHLSTFVSDKNYYRKPFSKVGGRWKFHSNISVLKDLNPPSQVISEVMSGDESELVLWFPPQGHGFQLFLPPQG